MSVSRHTAIPNSFVYFDANFENTISPLPFLSRIYTFVLALRSADRSALQISFATINKNISFEIAKQASSLNYSKTANKKAQQSACEICYIRYS